MKAMDNTIKYYELLMKYDDISDYKKYELPSGFHYEMFKDGDEIDWVNIHIESGEFTSIDRGLKYFHMFYDSFIEELNKRCIFIVDNDSLEKVGTATVSLLKEKEFGYDAAIDWVAIKKSYQGKGLSKPLISEFMRVANELGHKGLILHTQTTTWLAAKIYLDYGFLVLNKEEVEGWNILNTLTHHEKLKIFDEMALDEIFDKRNVLIEKKLVEMYGTDEFNYEVWYKDGLHNVYTYVNGKSYEYEYFYDGYDIKLIDVK